MLKIRKKQCAGWDGNAHPAFLYKNINGVGFCKACAFKLIPPKKIAKVSKDGKKKLEEKKKETEKQYHFFLEIWEERKRNDGRVYCEVTGEALPNEPLSIYFDHLLEKSSYPEYRYDKENIAIVKWDVHSAKTNGHPFPKHKALIDEFKKKRGLENGRL